MHHKEPSCMYVPFSQEELLGQRICISVISRAVTELSSNMAVPPDPGPTIGRKWNPGSPDSTTKAPTPAPHPTLTNPQSYDSDRPDRQSQSWASMLSSTTSEAQGSWTKWVFLALGVECPCSHEAVALEHTRPCGDTPWSPQASKRRQRSYLCP